MTTLTASPHYTVSVYDTISAVDVAAWNALRYRSSDPFMDPRFILAVERTMADTAKFQHVIFYDDDGRPAASACLCLFRVDATLLAEGFAAKLARAVGGLAPFLVRFNVVFCGLPVSAGQSNLRFAPGVDAAAILRQLDEILHDLARREKARCIVLKEFTADECTLLAELGPLGYRKADSLPMNCASPEYRDFDDFLAKLPSKKRYPIRKAQKKFQPSGLRVVQMTGGEGAADIYTDEVHRLYNNVLDRAKVRLERLPAEFFRELARQMPDDTSFTFVYDGDRVVAMAASLFSAGSFHQMFVGVDYDLNPKVDLYFNLFFHALDFGFRRQVAEIIVGQSADDFKHQKLGCHQKTLSFFVKGIDWGTRQVIRHAFHVLFPSHPLRIDAADEPQPS